MVTLFEIVRQRLQEPNRALQANDGSRPQGWSKRCNVSGREADGDEAVQHESMRSGR